MDSGRGKPDFKRIVQDRRDEVSRLQLPMQGLPKKANKVKLDWQQSTAETVVKIVKSKI